MLDTKLETLLTVCEKNNFTRAAEALSLTQPAVSHHIASLEQEFGVKIFYRGKGDLKLTPEGEIVVKYAKRIKALYDRMQEKLAAAGRQLTRIRVGITHTAESSLTAEVLAKYGSSGADGNISITIITDTINNLYDMLSCYEIDLAIVEGPVREAGFNSLLLDTDFLVCVMSNENPLASKSMITLNELKKEKLILRLPNSGTRNLFVSHLESVNMFLEDFDVVLEVDNIATIKDLIRKNLGVSILPRSTCLNELRTGKLTALPIENLSMIRETNILYPRDFDHTEILDALMRIYRGTAQKYR